MRIAVVRVTAVTAATLALSGASQWAWAAPASGTDRTGTWIALLAAVVVALAAGVVVLVSPGGHGARAGRHGARPAAAGPYGAIPPDTVITGPKPTHGARMRFEDTGEIEVQRALAAEAHARRADVGPADPGDQAERSRT
ncbi:hypothetical protein SDC9_67238 [bioreactor metagenome]|uniref:Uncharacterized protein n=1 Tax=bioreactor metagenome TaxID=1076179 RepID=A0A644XX22_9ZZZZ|nr:hypothetical protein [Raineyella sp.]